MPSDNLIADHLRQHFLFKGIEPSLFDELVKRIRTVELQSGEMLFHQDNSAERFFYVEHGHIKLSRVSITGQEKVIEVMSSGQTFAEAVMFMQRKTYPVDAQALAESRVYAIPNQAYRDILQKSTESCFTLLADLSMRLHNQVQELEHLAQQNASFRLTRYLVNRLPLTDDNQAEIELDIPKQVLASKLSIKPESFSRLLSSLSQQGIISVERNHIIVHDVRRLREYE